MLWAGMWRAGKAPERRRRGAIITHLHDTGCVCMRHGLAAKALYGGGKRKENLTF